jgi:serine/threonine protein kinase
MASPTNTRVFETATISYTVAVREPIGNGGAGVVYRVKDVDGNEFALKCLTAADSVKRKRFSRELTFCQQCHHENIVRVLDSGFDAEKKQPFYVMPLYDGTLRRRMQAGLAPDQVLPLFDQVLSGVEAAHLCGVYHRDLKPENILYDSAFNRLVVADFGIAHFEQEELLTAVETKDQERLANFTYAAPEQHVRGGAVDRRADIFALGLILNEMFTGSVPLGQGHPLIASFSPSHAYLDEIVARMIRHSPDDRYQTIDEIKKDLVARGNTFIAQQRLDLLRKQVVPATSPDDPLGGEVVSVVARDYEPDRVQPKRGQLIFNLNLAPPADWQDCFRQVRWHRYIPGIAEPSRVRFYPKGLGITIPEQYVEEVVPLVEAWISSANEGYSQKLKNDASKQHAAKIIAHQREQARAEEKARVAERLSKLLQDKS